MNPIWVQVLQVLGAIIVGGIIGFEREIRSKPAGLTTFMLVCVGSCLIAILQQNIIYETVRLASLDSTYASTVSADSGRLIAQVVSGIGFLGAGVIIYTRDVVKGVTTAALLWLVSALGLMIGIGGLNNYIIVFAALVLTTGFTMLSKKYKLRMIQGRKLNVVKIIYYDKNEDEFIKFLDEQGVKIKKQQFSSAYIKDGIHYKEMVFYFILSTVNFHDFVKAVASLDYICELSEI